MAANSKVRIVDPMFSIPDEVGDFEYTEDPLLALNLEADEESISDEGDESEDYLYDEGESGYYDEVETPDTFVVVAQNIRTLANGTQVVDLIVEVEDIAGADNYDFRVVKA